MSGGAAAASPADRTSLNTDPILAQAADWLAFMRGQLEAFLPIEAPANEESARSGWFLKQLQTLGYSAAEQDAAGNVLAPVEGGYTGRYLVLDAHLDTAFPRGTATRLQKNGARWTCPGVYDDGAGLAVLLALAKLFRQTPPPGGERVLFCFSAGEEGVGDLRGMRELCRERGSRIAALYACDGLFGKESIGTVGSRRYRVQVQTAGGHSWADFGRPSAIHELARWLAHTQGQLDAAVTTMAYARPGQASSYNVGTLRGGTTVNSIAARAECEIDLRSSDAAALARLRQLLEGSLAQFPWREGVRQAWTTIGDRPTAEVAATAVLRELRSRLHADFGVVTRDTLDSTNANWPLYEGIPATSVGVAEGGDAHTPEEWLDTHSLIPGLRFVYHLTARTLAHAAMQERFTG